MSKKSYAMHYAMILGSSAVLLVFVFILVAHHRNIPNAVKADRSVLLASGSSADARIKPVGEVAYAAAKTPQAPVTAPVAASTPVRDGQQVYQASCIACHAAGVAGAPKLGDKGQWATRIAKGLDTLYSGAVNGMQGSAGAMPAKGGNPALSDAEVKAAVDYMVAQSK
jgi:cytochrome c5